jgi:sugar transferase (PEP-CTERM/EpsH1 system associated)
MDASLFVSPAETQLFASLAPEAADRLHAVNNGVDTDYFSPERPYENPFPAGTRALVFTGAMDYWPNIDAVTGFAATLMPRIRSSFPDASFWIVGSNPSVAVRELASQPGINVTGRVPDVRPYLAHAAAVVAPLRIARGIQNKVLEAMAMARAVIATPQAAEGIEAQPGRDLLVPPTPEAFIEAVAQALRGDAQAAMGAQARSYVLATYHWQKSLYKLDLILDGTARREGPTATIGRSADMASY